MLRQAEQLQGLNQKFPWTDDDALKIFGMLWIFAEYLWREVYIEALSPVFQQFFKARNIECLHLSLIICNILEFKFNLTLFLLTKLL